MEEMLLKGLAYLLSKSELAVSVFAFIGLARSINKVLQPFLKELVRVTPSEKDDALLDKLLSSKAYAGFVFLMDLLLSVKLPKLEEKKEEKNNA